MTRSFVVGLSMSWGFGLFLAGFALANFGPASALGLLGVTVMLGTYVCHTIAGWEERAAEASRAES
ncbi:hypothetical protein [Knoellia subterranea]|uniref:Uncharacterized protein n=1 Tax=Knoellia subterranea KCTC 19937 TaxID=1385521 RepID=A0A0A0JI77_9MICO|nr:hypothetical protein [Knoellia subterranea]KGN36828.1 hypothetical protein N803_16810 [Knoellia subterranea KCTC 19937]